MGAALAGLRRIAPVTGGTFAGERLSGTVIGGADWVINRPDGVMVIDVRLTLKTDDGANLLAVWATPQLEAQGRKLPGKIEIIGQAVKLAMDAAVKDKEAAVAESKK